MKGYSYIIILAIYCIGFGQLIGQNNLTQLYNEKSQSDSDTLTIRKHLEIAKILTTSDPAVAVTHVDSAYQLAVEKKFILGQVRSLISLSILANNNNQHSDAIAHLTKAGDILSTKDTDKKRLGIINLRLGQTYNQMSRYYKAIEHFQIASVIYEDIADTLSIANTLTNIGMVHILLEDKISAFEHYDQAAKLYRQIDHQEGLVYYYNNIGHINYTDEKYDLALPNYIKGLELAIQTDMKYMEGHIYGNLGLLYRDKNDTKTALEYLEKEKRINTELSNESKLLYPVLAISKIKFDETKNPKYLDTINYCLDKARLSGDLTLQTNALKDLSEIHSYLNEHEDAYKYLTQYHKLKDSTNNNQLKQRINTLKLNHEIQRVQRAKESELTSAKLIRNIALAAALCLVFFSFLINRSYLATKKVRVKLESKNKQLLEADKTLEKKNKDLEKYIDSNMQLKQFAHIASHDIKSPLRTILSFSSLLKRNLYSQVGGKEKTYFDAIETGAKRITALVEDLLEYSTLNSQKLSLSKFSIQELVEEVSEHLVFSISEKNVSINIPESDLSIIADRTKIKQVIQNLLDNAIKFSSEESNPVIDISYKQDKQYYTITVADNGIGIDCKYVDEIFKEFVQLNRKEEFEGTGLGLSICKNYISKHLGEISVQPRKPKGTTFSFTINKKLGLNYTGPQKDNVLEKSKV